MSHMTLRGGLAILLTLPACSPRPADRQEVAITLQCFHGLEPPYHLEPLGGYGTGATGRIHGAHGLFINYYYALGQVVVRGDSVTQPPDVVYIGGREPHDRNATALESGSACESAFIALLLEYASGPISEGNKRSALRMASKLEGQHSK